jgi:hypothetical protein
VVGYGRVGGSQASRPEVGIKRRAAVVSAQCPRATAGQPGISSENHVCVTVADGDDAGTCQGDSGGPFLADFGDGPVVAGVTSGGATDHAELDCLPQSVSFFTDVFRYRNFVAAQLGGDGATCDGLDAVGAPGTMLRIQDGVLAFPSSRFETTLEVPVAAEALRVNMNGEFLTAGGFNDFDLFVNFGAPAGAGQSLCSDTSGISFGACEVRAPAAGTWHVAVESFSGAGRFQLVTALFGVPSSGVCAGDCDGDGAVRIDELIRCVSIAGGADLGTCSAIDLDLDGGARIEELVAAVNAALQGC